MAFLQNNHFLSKESQIVFNENTWTSKKKQKKRSGLLHAARFLSPRPEPGTGDVKTKDVRGLPSGLHRPVCAQSSGKGDPKNYSEGFQSEGKTRGD